MKNIRSLIEGMQTRLHWIDRANYMLTEEQKVALERMANELAEMETDIGKRA